MPVGRRAPPSVWAGDHVAAHDRLYDAAGRCLPRDHVWQVLLVGWVPAWRAFGAVLVDRRGVIPYRVPGVGGAYLARVVDTRDLVVLEFACVRGGPGT